MKPLIKLIVLIAFWSSAASLVADEVKSDAVADNIAQMPNEKLPEAPVLLVEGLKVECQALASDNKVGNLRVNRYLLDCINQDLDIMGYRMIKKLP